MSWFTDEDRAKAAIEIRRIYMQQIATTEGDSSFELDAASAALSAVNPYEWRGMDSAPRDGTIFLAVNMRGAVVKRPHFFCSSTPVPDGSKRWADEAGWMTPGRDWPCYPTHWKPLDLPPSPEGDK